ncbi:MAG: hypothetical protein K5657_00535 [Desulfovibrio sp.]|nr:hypothetical protein [Desulfovibrio sp.]
MRLFALATVLLSLCLSQNTAAAEKRIFLDCDAPRYTNTVYGFSFALPAGQWDAMEKNDGREISVHDGSEGETDVTRIRVTVRDGYADIPLQTLLDNEAKRHVSILKKEVGQTGDWFAITAKDSKNNLVLVTYHLRGDRANILEITAPGDQKASFDMVSRKMAESFKPGFGHRGR